MPCTKGGTSNKVTCNPQEKMKQCVGFVEQPHPCSTFAAPVRHLSSTCAAPVQHISSTCAAPFQHLCNTFPAHVQHLCNTCAAPVQHLCSTFVACTQFTQAVPYDKKSRRGLACDHSVGKKTTQAEKPLEHHSLD